jgi:hypothetical protein
MRRLIVGLTLALALVTPPAAARQAVALVNPPAAPHAIGAMTISTFYMSTKAAFDVWNPQAAPPAPPRVHTFPATLRGLAYYFEFKGAAKSTTFKVNVRDHTGALVYVGVSYSLGTVAAGSDMATFFHSFRPGTYTAHLRINGQPIRSTTFRVAPTVPLPTISTFYASTRAAYDHWDRTTPLPPVSTFPAHTRHVAFYFEFEHSTGSGSTSGEVYVRDQRGAIVTSVVSDNLLLTYTAYAGYLTAQLTGGYSVGTYTMFLLINGRAVRKSAIFTVQPPAPAATPTSPPPAATPTPQPPPPTATSTPPA